MASVLDGIRATINKKYAVKDIAAEKTNTMQSGVPLERFKNTFSLGSPALDFITYNAIPEGIFIEIAGPEASGKTTLAFKIAADFIRKEKEKFNKKQAENDKIYSEYVIKRDAAIASGKKPPVEPILAPYEIRHILFVDAEGTADPLWAYTSSGYDMNDQTVLTEYMTPKGQSAEQIFDDVITYVKSGYIGLVIFDSLVAISSQQVAGQSMEKKMMGGIASALTDFVKRTTGLFNANRTTFIGINGIYSSLDGYGNPERIGGGNAWKRACSLRLKVQRGYCFNDDGEEWSPTGKDAAKQASGHIIEVALLKTKFCRWDRKLAKCHLNYVRGLDILQDTIDVATFFNIIQEPSAGYFLVTDPDTGEVLTGKIHGKNNIKPYFEQNVEVWRKVYDKCYEQLARKDVPNVVSYEKMLNINVEELFGIDFAKEQEEQL